MRSIARPFWVLLALVFLLEAWLWDHLEPVAAWLVARFPLQRLKAKLRDWVDHLPAPATLIVFALPGALLLPFKLLGLWLLARDQWISAIGLFILAKLVGLGFSAFVFDLTRPKLLQMAWFRALYETVMAWRTWAKNEVRPIQRRIRALIFMSRPGRRGKLIRRLARLRRKMHGPEPAT
jgi:hypothetical protein